MKALHVVIACLLSGLFFVIAAPAQAAAGRPIQSDYIQLKNGGSTTMTQLGAPNGTGTFTNATNHEGYRYHWGASNRLFYVTGDAVPDPANPGEYLKPVMTASSSNTAIPSATAFTLTNVSPLNLAVQDISITVPNQSAAFFGDLGYHDLIHSTTGLPGTDGTDDGFTGTQTLANGLEITHTAQIARNEYTGVPDVIEYFFIVTNPSTSDTARVFGLSWNVDTQVGEASGASQGGDIAPFRAPGIRQFTVDEAAVGFPIPSGSAAETRYSSLTPSLFDTGANPYPDSVPQYVYALHPTRNWSVLIRTNLGARGRYRGVTWQPADYMGIDRYSRICSTQPTSCNYYFYGANNGQPYNATDKDSGHMLRWNPQVLKPGETIYLAFSYGATNATNYVPGKINFLDQKAPVLIFTDPDNRFYTNAPFTSETKVTNLSTADISSGTITLKIPRAYLRVEDTMLAGGAWVRDDARSDVDPDHDYYTFAVGTLDHNASLTAHPPVHLNVVPQYLTDIDTTYWLFLEVETDAPAPIAPHPEEIEKKLSIPKLVSNTITATADANGTISPSGGVLVGYDGSQTFTFTPNSGYRISDVQVDGVSQGAISSYTFTNVTSDHTISVSFAPIPLSAATSIPALTPAILLLLALALGGLAVRYQRSGIRDQKGA
ncbi:MAG: hypothetical protein FWC38_08765 [Proteobacteria bacterium]|nr:hypothetical protein [Pseudomonadota bacterium]MCL2308292.1 hypothetical protein [Pseudomonadota bacterium]